MLINQLGSLKVHYFHFNDKITVKSRIIGRCCAQCLATTSAEYFESNIISSF